MVFTTADNRLTLEFPAGVLTAQSTVTIQPITNNCPGGTGTGYRITPHIAFNEPVKLGFSYCDSDYVSSMPAAMTIGNSIVAANLDTENPDGVTLKWVGSHYVNEYLPWKATSWPMFLYGPDPVTTYMQMLLPDGSASPGGLYFLLGSEGLDYAVGSFVLQPAQRIIANPGSIPQYSRHTVEGYFKVKWGKE